MIRFHLDENVDQAIAHGLRLRGLDVTTATDADLIAAADLEHITFALAENRVIFTQDQDFLRHHLAGDEHAGIVYSDQGVRSIGEIVRYLHFLSDCLERQTCGGYWNSSEISLSWSNKCVPVCHFQRVLTI